MSGKSEEGKGELVLIERIVDANPSTRFWEWCNSFPVNNEDTPVEYHVAELMRHISDSDLSGVNSGSPPAWLKALMECRAQAEITKRKRMKEG